MWLYTFDKKGEFFDENQDHSSIYEIIVAGPIILIINLLKHIMLAKQKFRITMQK